MYRWPIFLITTPSSTGLGADANFGLRVATTLSISSASYHWLEEPIRQSRGLGAPVGARAALAASVAVALLTAVRFPTTAQHILAAG